MVAVATALAVAAPLVLANERSLFHFPMSQDAFRLQRIERTDNEAEWPFSVASGYLLCAWVMGTRAVYFAEDLWEEGEDQPRLVIVSTDPFELVMSNLGSGGLFAEAKSVEQLIVRVAPFERLGERLCDQPRGADIGPGEL